MIEKAHFILYVKEQGKSAAFYSKALALEPALDVPGMTEFHLPGGAVLGIMPEAGIKRLLGERLPDPSKAGGAPRSEVYLVVDGARTYHERALEAGAIELSPLRERDWGHLAAYSLDPDGHVLVFAETPPGPPVEFGPISADDAAAVSAFTAEHWGADFVVAHGTVYYPARLKGFKASSENRLVGLVTCNTQGSDCEVVTLNSTSGGRGVGTRLMGMVKEAAIETGCGRVWLVTTNDNLGALRFYQRLGYRLVKVGRDALEASRALKPSIPTVGNDGIQMRDEVELELRLK